MFIFFTVFFILPLYFTSRIRYYSFAYYVKTGNHSLSSQKIYYSHFFIAISFITVNFMIISPPTSVDCIFHSFALEKQRNISAPLAAFCVNDSTRQSNSVVWLLAVLRVRNSLAVGTGKVRMRRDVQSPAVFGEIHALLKCQAHHRRRRRGLHEDTIPSHAAKSRDCAFQHGTFRLAFQHCMSHQRNAITSCIRWNLRPLQRSLNTSLQKILRIPKF